MFMQVTGRSYVVIELRTVILHGKFRDICTRCFAVRIPIYTVCSHGPNLQDFGGGVWT